MEKTQMLQRCQTGDIEAIEQVYQSYYPAMFRLAYSILLNRDEADEVAKMPLSLLLMHWKPVMAKHHFEAGCTQLPSIFAGGDCGNEKFWND